MTLEQHFAQIAAQVKAQLAAADQSHFCLTIRAEGRVHDGTVKIEIMLGEYSYRDQVTGREVDKVLREYLRRNGWDAANTPLELPDYTSQQSHSIHEKATLAVVEGKALPDDEIPF